MGMMYNNNLLYQSRCVIEDVWAGKTKWWPLICSGTDYEIKRLFGKFDYASLIF